MNLKTFYDNHINFSERTDIDYHISPGIKCKFDIIKERVGCFQKYKVGIDLGCSGDSLLSQIRDITHKSYLDIANVPLKLYPKKANPVCGDMQFLPYKNESFDIIFALDVLEHLEYDIIAISELSRILKKNGIAIITVPHRKRYYTNQDRIIGHFRRYEIGELKSLFRHQGLKLMDIFGIYGALMRLSFYQSLQPQKTEKGILKLRQNYQKNKFFMYFWKKISFLLSRLMKLDAKYTQTKKMMNIGFIFIKNR